LRRPKPPNPRQSCKVFPPLIWAPCVTPCVNVTFSARPLPLACTPTFFSLCLYLIPPPHTRFFSGVFCALKQETHPTPCPPPDFHAKLRLILSDFSTTFPIKPPPPPKHLFDPPRPATCPLNSQPPSRIPFFPSNGL